MESLRASKLNTKLNTNHAARGPVAVFFGKGQLYGYSGSTTAQRQVELHRRYMRTVWVQTGEMGVRRFAEGVHIVFPRLRPPLLGGLVFYTLGPVFALAAALRRAPTAVVCQSPYEAFGVVSLSRVLPRKMRPPIQIEIHSDWRTAPRLYGSRARLVLAPLTDRIATWTLRHADRVRVVSGASLDWVRRAGYTGPVDHYVHFSDYSRFLERPSVPLPPERNVVFVGSFQRYKAVDVLIECWSAVLRRFPDARLLMVGSGPLEKDLRRRIEEKDIAHSVEIVGYVEQDRIAQMLDHAWCLVLPSRSEGQPRVVLEAMARARPVVVSTVGGLPELVIEGRTGWLVPPEQPGPLARALVEALSDVETTSKMGMEARRHVNANNPLEEYESGIARLADWIILSLSVQTDMTAFSGAVVGPTFGRVVVAYRLGDQRTHAWASGEPSAASRAAGRFIRSDRGFRVTR